MNSKINVSALHLFFSCVIPSEHPVMLDKDGKIGKKFKIKADKEAKKVFVSADDYNFPIGIELCGKDPISGDDTEVYIAENFEQIVKAIKDNVSYIPTRSSEGASLVTSEQIFSFTLKPVETGKGEGLTPQRGFKFGF